MTARYDFWFRKTNDLKSCDFGRFCHNDNEFVAAAHLSHENQYNCGCTFSAMTTSTFVAGAPVHEKMFTHYYQRLLTFIVWFRRFWREILARNCENTVWRLMCLKTGGLPSNSSSEHKYLNTLLIERLIKIKRLCGTERVGWTLDQANIQILNVFLSIIYASHSEIFLYIYFKV